MLTRQYCTASEYLPQAKRSPATDIYGLAATLYTLLTAQVPVAATLRDRLPLATPREVRPEVSAMVSAGVMRGLAIEPHHRPASIDEWLALLPNTAVQAMGEVIPMETVKQNATAYPNSHMATLAVSPAHYSIQTEAEPVVAASSKRGRVRPWLLGLVGLAAIVPFGLGYALLRSPHSSSDPTTQMPAVDSSAPSPNATESEAIPEDAEPASTQAPTATDDSADSPEASSSEELTTTEPVPPPPAETSAPIETEPAPREAEVTAEDTEAVRRVEEQAREDRKREEEQAREAQRREEERAREAQRREEERAREEERGRNEERGERRRKN
ncbi:hypothetical protein [Leptolyngbya sp. FACHB-16]|uniref:hypothetical protein n=1 Tax=unclassified Leptolyngbya TaxID=2650499 RepID=UPI001686F11B|nr:hypothetical protein [Leptolyngbya sp. FACHB-16]MBD2156582.1 hypothetical protein [Leptolyngbya sp. FACHB-16]